MLYHHLEAQQKFLTPRARKNILSPFEEALQGNFNPIQIVLIFFIRSSELFKIIRPFLASDPLRNVGFTMTNP